MNPSDDITLTLGEFIPRTVRETVQVFDEGELEDGLHIDVFHARSGWKDGVQWLFTAGMSRELMKPTAKYSTERYAELMTCLPPEWPLTAETFRTENNYWPIRLLRRLVRYSFQNNTWLSLGHSVRSEKPLGPNTLMSAAILTRPTC